MTRTLARLHRLLTAAALCIAVAGCDSLAPYVKSAPSTVEASSVPRDGHIRPGDKAKIIVYGEDKMSGDFEVDANGMIALPLVGAVKAAGMTKKEFEQALKARLRSEQILLNPTVTVDVAASRPFYIMGEVEKPGEYAYRTGLDVLSAAAVAGGFTYRASKSKVLVRRAGEKTLTEYPLSPDIPVYAGDLISVPERYF